MFVSGLTGDEFVAELAPLAPIGFPVADWIPTVTLNSYLDISSVKNFINMFNRIEDEMARDDCLAIGIKKGFWTEITSCNFFDMYDFTLFIESEDGINLLHDLAKKRAQIDKAYLSLLNLQLSGLALAKKCKRAELEDEMRCLLAQQQLELEKKVDNVDALFFPCAQYQPLDEVTLLKRCYEKYFIEATKLSEKGMEVLELEQDLLETLKVKYEAAVRQEHLHEFMRDEDRRNAIKVWANQKILEFGERKEASILHHLLADT